jgi:serine kinase of HPr protein (carbohydrate metabolism regulator)
MKSMHGSCVQVGGAGVLIRGMPGVGKSHLVQLLLGMAAAHGRFARLVADDRVILLARHGRLVAQPHPEIAGLLEIRGLGIVSLGHEAAAVVRLLVDLVAPSDMVRMPDHADGVERLSGVELPRLLASEPAKAAITICQLTAMPTSTLAFAAQHANHARHVIPAVRQQAVAGCPRIE